MKKLILALTFLLISSPAFAELNYIGGYHPEDSNYKYFQKTNDNYQYPHSIIFAFYNSRNPCHNCDKALSMLREFYDKNYSGIYDYYAVDYETDKEYNYIEAYKLHGPLEIVLVRVRNNHSEGYKKIDNIQNHVSNKSNFERELKDKIDDYLKE